MVPKAAPRRHRRPAAARSAPPVGGPPARCPPCSSCSAAVSHTAGALPQLLRKEQAALGAQPRCCCCRAPPPRSATGPATAHGPASSERSIPGRERSAAGAPLLRADGCSTASASPPQQLHRWASSPARIHGRPGWSRSALRKGRHTSCSTPCVGLRQLRKRQACRLMRREASKRGMMPCWITSANWDPKNWRFSNARVGCGAAAVVAACARRCRPGCLVGRAGWGHRDAWLVSPAAPWPHMLLPQTHCIRANP